ncbi:MAG: pitrilysin family protein [Pseudomonadota bacterium]
MRAVLPNGLTLVHEHIESAPVAAYHLFVGVGSAHEQAGEGGSAHFLEHMLFKGTERRDSIAINDEIENLGGNVNAFTTYDHTVYHLVLPSRFWRQGLDVFADMLFHSQMDEEEFEIERQVILEEIREGDDALDNFLGEKFFESIYPGHPYGRPVIATAGQIRKISVETAKSFYARGYRPKNMVLAVAGNVEWNLLCDAVRDFSGELTNGSTPVPTIPPAANLEKNVFTSIARGSEERILEAAFAIPGAHHPDVAALELLSVVLAGGETSRLYRELRLKREVTRSIQTNLFIPLQRGSFVFHALPYAGHEGEAVREIVRQLRLLKTELISPLELSRAKLTLEKEMAFGDETAEGRARTLGYFELTYGSYEEEAKYRARVLATTEGEVRGAAAKYFDFDRMGLALLLPKQEKSLTPQEIQKWVDAGERIRKRPILRVQKEDDLERFELSRGTRVVFRRLPGSRICSLYAAVKGGLWTETPETNGISTLIASTVDRGTVRRADDQIADEVTLLQADLDGIAARNFQGLRMEMVQRNLESGLDLFFDVLLSPTFDKPEIKQERNVLIRELETQEDYFETAASNLFLEAIYPCHPFGMNLLGRKDSLEGMTGAALRKHYRSYVRPERLVIGVVGEIDPDLLRERMDALVPKVPKGGPMLSGPAALLPLKGLTEIRRPIRGEKAYVQYGFRGSRLDSPDRFALDVLSALLASSGGGRLYVRLREELGLVYSADTSVMHSLTEGHFSISFNTAPEQVEQAMDEIRAEVGRVRETPAAADELERVKNFLIGNYEIDLQRTGPQAAQLCLGELYGTDRSLADYTRGIQRVTAKEVQQAALRYLTPDDAVMVLLSPAVN